MSHGDRGTRPLSNQVAGPCQSGQRCPGGSPDQEQGHRRRTAARDSGHVRAQRGPGDLLHRPRRSASAQPDFGCEATQVRPLILLGFNQVVIVTQNTEAAPPHPENAWFLLAYPSPNLVPSAVFCSCGQSRQFWQHPRANLDDDPD